MQDQFLKRSTESRGAVLNCDNAGLNAYRIQKAARKDQEQRLNSIEEDVAQLRTNVSEILNILKSLTVSK